MESLFIRKIYLICESLLFGKIKITLPNFLRRCKKQDIKLIHVISQRVVAFLQSLPKNPALFQALEPTFGYIIQEQLTLSKEDQEFIIMIEKLEFFKHSITFYEFTSFNKALSFYENNKNLFAKNFGKKLEKEKRDVILKYNLYYWMNNFDSRIIF